VKAPLDRVSEIRVRKCPYCYLCGKDGTVAYAGLEDKLFGVSGRWDFKICSNKACRLMWLDPMPVPADLSKAYAGYYTHGDRGKGVHSTRLREVYARVKLAYLSSALGYRCERAGKFVHALAKLLFFFPNWRREIEGEVMFLRAQEKGKLLDIGCGSGEWLVRMRDLGWTVNGLDFDERAVAVARQRQLNVCCGTVPEIQFPAGWFDAITLNHVIEHVPDPCLVLKECNRILKVGGNVVLATPNNRSWGHMVFRKDWRGLEPPRHLHLFCPKSIEETFKRAGFRSLSIRTLDSAYIWRQSVALRFGATGVANRFGSMVSKLVAAIFNFVERIGLMLGSSGGECLLVIATKDEPVE
jgi:2-polyprenyl-3-methyl-5-hydroxy-6-metoxy-1,4-benzoquinol methylase